MRVTFHPAALLEIDEAYDWYEAQQRGTGAPFARAVANAVDRLTSMPDVSPRVEAGCQRCRVTGFPYGVVFEQRRGQIQVYAVMHLRRKPGYWRDRMD